MKKIGLILLALTLVGCGQSKSSVRQSDNINTVENVINNQMAEIESEPETEVLMVEWETEEETETTTFTEKETETVQTDDEIEATEDDTVDYDLTAMNADMVYAIVYQMLVDPDTYVGKTVKMSGPFYPYTNMDGTVYYPACIIEDALACCAQGMEFVLKDAKYPADYPELGKEITVIGTFETYAEDDLLYCHLTDAVLEIDD